MFLNIWIYSFNNYRYIFKEFVMAKQQEFIDLFAKYDDDKDGQINQQQFINVITELQVPYQYPGTVSKIIRKLNYANPGKQTLNLEQAKQYYNSFESISKHQIWKAKTSLLIKAEEIKLQINEPKEESGAAPAAAPGTTTPSQEPQKSPQEARINVLIGQAQPVYTSEIDIQIEKTVQSQKVKPFLKLTITSTTEARAKELQTIFKENVSSFFAILSEETPDYADVIKDIHINSMVVETKTTFFVTTTNQEVIQFIQLLGEFFELSFSTQLASKLHLRFEFDYDFERFINEENSNFYDIFTRNCRLSIDATLLNLLKSLRKFFKADIKENPYMDSFEAMFFASLLHIEAVQGDFQFQNSEVTQYQSESKAELKELLKQWRQFFDKLTSSGMKVKQLLQLLDETISIQFKGGEWKANIFLRLKNLNRIFLHEFPSSQNSDQAPQQININQLNKSGSQESVSSKNSLKNETAHKPFLPSPVGSQKSIELTKQKKSDLSQEDSDD